jgi:hypothetical protein
MQTFKKWMILNENQVTPQTKHFKTIKEAREWLGVMQRGHGTVKCSCGNMIECCRCVNNKHYVAIVENGCEKCGG